LRRRLCPAKGTPPPDDDDDDDDDELTVCMLENSVEQTVFIV